ncbi:hypothetical protein MRX96_032011 [Rhipicephalus microplus]
MCTWRGWSNPMASPTAPPRDLDPFSHYNTSAPSAFSPMTQERGTPTPGASTQGHPVAAAAHYSAGGTSSNNLVCFHCEGRGHYRSPYPSKPRPGCRGNDRGRRW